MPGLSILRRSGVDIPADVEGPRDRRALRKSAFEANLALQLEKALGGDASISDIEAITRILGAAYENVRHVVDARTSLNVFGRRYFVLQFGCAPCTGDNRLDALDPYAARLLNAAPAAEMAHLQPRLKAIGGALAKTEISRRHPIDLRWRLNTPWLRFYVNFISGLDKRKQTNLVTHDRRKPVNEKLGLVALLAIAIALSLLGVAMIASTIWAFWELMMSQMGRDAMAALFDRSMSSLFAIFDRLG